MIPPQRQRIGEGKSGTQSFRLRPIIQNLGGEAQGQTREGYRDVGRVKGGLESAEGRGTGG
jgi:hypothetical protein